MKNIKIIILFVIFFAAGNVISSCGGDSGKKTEQQSKEHTSAYVCPMHCEGSGSDEPGNCPVCGMEYEKNENHKADGHTH